ncbi:peptidoglycan DD-metalloendopeptidase family protein [Alteromonas sp. BMJM2]|uniref:peptidoglycan DD-metalloendopeptidase family protein n=1 Tax=Alteromonas sp. BMJM2 TaxID=2954241 RepID=UPI0022B3A5B2|nr:peptidoglycan DD-metalloendopeptidase family protein [Alteromonas sp. BMJM2]
MKNIFFRHLLIYTLLTLMIGCAGRSAPAPVVLLNSQVESGSEEYTASTYKVRPGDTLFAVAWFTGNDYQDIAKFNNISKPYTIFPGQTLRLTAPVSKPALTKRSNVTTTRSTDPTSPTVTKRVIDQSKSQAYVEGEQDVKAQKNTNVKKSTGIVKKTAPTSFPDKVEKWIWPAEGKLVGTFSKAESGNKGIDVAGVRGSKIVAAASGKVVYSGNALRGYGKLIIIKHTDTFLSAYAYNETILVKEREWVYAGQKIATMGSSGTDSVKLHFEVRYRGKSLNPLRYLPKL